MRCRACGGEAIRPTGEKNGVALFQCDCGSLNADVHPGAVPPYAESYVGAKFEASRAVKASLAETVAGLEAFRRVGRWADIGFGEAALLVEAQAMGWECSGTEISRASLAFGRSRGWDVRSSSKEWPDEHFDVVSLIEVLEHVLDPEDLLREASRLLRPGGALIATTPNIGSLNYRLLGTRWTIVGPPEHITLFSAGALRRLVQGVTFRILTLRTSGLNPTEILRREQAPATAAERNAGAQRLVDATSSGTGRAVKRFLNSTLSILGAGDTLKLVAMKPNP